ncbi:prolyl oligopeptidase family serine peptidase [Lentimicrobium sp.]
MRKVTIVIMLCLLSGMAGLTAQNLSQQAHKYTGRYTKPYSLNYLLYQPEQYIKDKGGEWPLLVFLHGSGERGADLEKVKVHGPPMLIAGGRQFPFFVLSPQCPEGQDWDAEALHTLIGYIVDNYPIDEKRVYLTGLSMGGKGVWDLAFAHPDDYAAIVPVCGRVDRNYADRAAELGDMAVWVFHGAMDDVVPIAPAARMVNKLQEAGNKAKFTIYPEAGHDSWTDTYNNPLLYEWLLEQKCK